MLRPVLPGVYLIDLPWVNVWLLRDGDDAVLIDTGVAHDRSRLLQILLEAFPKGPRLHTILLTHAHCDHAGNAAFLAERFGAQLVVHAEEAPFLGTRRTYVPRGIRALSPQGILFALGEIVFPVRRRVPDRVVCDGDTIETPIGPLTVIHTPGHTAGHTSYLAPRIGGLFSGDALLNVIPFVRRNGLSLPPPIFSSDMQAVRHSARRLIALEPRALLAGHGWPLLQEAATELHAFGRTLHV